MSRYIKIFSAIVLLSAFTAFSPFEAKPALKSNRAGNIETVEAVKNGETVYRLVYTYEGARKVRGEYWEAVDAKKKKEKKPESNILAGTAVAKKYETMLAGSRVEDTSGVVLDIEKNGFVLRNVRIVKYNDKGLPSLVMARGYTSYPVLGVFNLKTDYSYTYDQAGNLSLIKETNMNVDSLLLNMGLGNITTITRDAKSRPLSVKKEIGSVPPALESTEYTCEGATDTMQRTVYRKCSLDIKTLTAVPSETITIDYGKNVPWRGMKKYEFEMGKTIKGISVYDDVNKKQKLDGSRFVKFSMIEKAKFMKSIYDMYKNEMQGPRWRMGELPDVPEPFMVYRDYAWWN